MTTKEGNGSQDTHTGDESKEKSSNDQSSASSSTAAVPSNSLHSAGSTGGATSAATIAAGKVAAAATLAGSSETAASSKSSSKTEANNADVHIKTETEKTASRSAAETNKAVASSEMNTSTVSNKAAAASSIQATSSTAPTKPASTAVSTSTQAAGKSTAPLPTTAAATADTSKTSPVTTTTAATAGKSTVPATTIAAATAGTSKTSSTAAAAKPLDTTDGGSAASSSGKSSFFSLWNFHPLRALRNIFFGYKQREERDTMESSPRAPEKRKRALSTDDLDKKSRESRVSVMFSKISGKRSKPYNREKSRSADNLIEQEDWIPANHDPCRPDNNTASSSKQAEKIKNKHKGSDEKHRIKTSISSDLAFNAPVIIEDDWASEFFTEGWSADKQERRADACEAGIAEMDAIGANCSRLDTKAMKDRLAVKQKGKRKSSALLLKSGGRLNSETRSPLSSVTETSEADETSIKLASAESRKTGGIEAKKIPNLNDSLTSKLKSSPENSRRADEKASLSSPIVKACSVNTTHCSMTTSSPEASVNEASESATNSTIIATSIQSTSTPMEKESLAVETGTSRSDEMKKDSARQSMFMDDLKASVQRSSSRRLQVPPKVLPKKIKLSDNAITDTELPADAAVNDRSNESEGQQTAAGVANKLDSDQVETAPSTASLLSAQSVENIPQNNSDHLSTEIKKEASDTTDSDAAGSAGLVPDNSNTVETASDISVSVVNAPETKTSVAHVSLRTIRTGSIDVPSAGSRLTAPSGMDQVFRAPSPCRVNSTSEPIQSQGHPTYNDDPTATKDGSEEKMDVEIKAEQEEREHNTEVENSRIYARLKNQEVLPVVRQQNRKKPTDAKVTKVHCVTKL